MMYQITATRDERVMVFGVAAESFGEACVKALEFVPDKWTVKARMIAPVRYRG